MNTWYQPEEGCGQVELIVSLKSAENIGYLVLKEAIQYSQRVEVFEIFVRNSKEWISTYSGTVIGYQKIIPVFRDNVKEIKIVIRDYRILPLISFVGIYKNG